MPMVSMAPARPHLLIQLQSPALCETQNSSCLTEKSPGFVRVEGKTLFAFNKSRFQLRAPLAQPSRDLRRENTTQLTAMIILL